MGEYNEKMIAAKEKLLERFRSKERRSGARQRDRLPPGQHLAKGFPVLDLGVRPKFYEPRWRFRVDGEVERELDLSWPGSAPCHARNGRPIFTA
jgi:DMSO/TMAO reductase YedYZ molybdopterin-dependent catalytic subunit